MTTARLGIEITVDEKGDIKIKDLGPMAEKSAKQAEKGFEKTGQAVKKTSGIVGELSDKIQEFGPLIASYFGAQAISGVINLADDMSALNGTLKIATDSTEEYLVVQELLYQQSQESASQLQANTKVFASIETALDGQADSSSKALEVLDNLNKSLRITNASTQDSASFMLQTKQAVSSANVQWEELGPILEANVDFSTRLTKALGTTRAGLKEMTSESQLSGDAFLDAILSMSDAIDQDFANIPLTIDRAKVQISNAFAKIISDGNEVSNGTNSIATEISGLATVVDQNAPAIQAMFGVIVTGAEVAVRGVSFLEGTFKAVGAAASGVYAGVVAGVIKIMETQQALRGALGLDTSTSVAEIKMLTAELDVAQKVAVKLAEESDDAFARMTGNIEKNTEAEKSYRAELEQNLASIEADKAAQQARSDLTVAGINKITEAERKAAEERQATVAQMWETLGVGGEDYFRNEAQKILDQAAKWEEAGASAVETQQWQYEQIKVLSEEAWAAQEQSAGMYLDGLTSIFTSAVADISDDLAALDQQEINVPADVQTEPAAQGIAYVDSEIDRLNSEVAMVEIDGDNTGALSALAEVQEQTEKTTSLLEQAMSGTGGRLAVNADDILSGAVDILGSKGVYRAAQRARNADEDEFTYRSGTYKTADFYNFAGGGYTFDGSRSGGVDGKGGQVAVVHPDEVFVDLQSPRKGLQELSARLPASSAAPTAQRQQVTNIVNNNNSSSVVINVTQPMTPAQIVDIGEKQKLLNKRVIS